VPTHRPYVVLPAVFGARQCDRIVALADHHADEEARLAGGPSGDTVTSGIRRSATAWLPHDDATAWVVGKLAVAAERANRTWRLDLDPVDDPDQEDLQLTTYDSPGAHYTWHQDGLDGDVARRKLSLVVQLSDPADYDGGDLEFMDLLDPDPRDPWVREERARLRARGTVVAFPAFEYHRVTPLRAGVRRSLVWWISGPPFR
jgi:PKHD-type hydroxylase